VPGSLLAGTDGQETPDMHQMYRSLDYMLDTKEDMEWYLHKKLTDLFSLKLFLNFYDLTSQPLRDYPFQSANGGQSPPDSILCTKMLINTMIIYNCSIW
jgi:hypothetical protein